MLSEFDRLAQHARREADWQLWGPYLAERQWGTVREDYSASGDAWREFPHRHAPARTYRWGEDGLLGFTDRMCNLCFSIGLWNERDLILKERLFGLSGPEGNHGEDVKELYYYLDSSPCHTYSKALYKYPQAQFPYDALVKENARRSKADPEFELLDTGLFNENRYFEVLLEYAVPAPGEVLILITVTNRGPEAAKLHLLPQLWFRNTWSWGCKHEGCSPRPSLRFDSDGQIGTDHFELGTNLLQYERDAGGQWPRALFTENSSNLERLFGGQNESPYVKDSFHRWLIEGDKDAVNPALTGTKCALHYEYDLAAGESASLRLRLTPPESSSVQLDEQFDEQLAQCRTVVNEYYAEIIPDTVSEDERQLARQAYAGLIWSRQFYHYSVRDWLDGDPGHPASPEDRAQRRNQDWEHLFNRRVISMPDSWEYPWYAAWDLAFHMVPFARLDPHWAKRQLLLFLREWYMHPNGQIPAYEWNFSDVNPPVHAWSCLKVFRAEAAGGTPDYSFLERAFQKLLINFTWWVNRKDVEGHNLFAGGFLGLDNIGVFNRSEELPGGAHLAQADGTAWMAFYCSSMLSIALELALHNPTYEDVATKFFEHFVAIADAVHEQGGAGLWDEEDGFYYDLLLQPGKPAQHLKVRSMVGLISLCAVCLIDEKALAALPSFRRRFEWVLTHRQDLAEHVTLAESPTRSGCHSYLLAIPSRQHLRRVLDRLFDEDEFLSPHGIRSLSKYHQDHPFRFQLDGTELQVGYIPGASDTGMFGGNSNWRGPVWFPVNYLLIEALDTYATFYGDELLAAVPTGSQNELTLSEAADEIRRRLTSLFLPDADGARPAHGDDGQYANDPHFRDHILFYEFFHGDDGSGLGANHQTGWTALAATLVDELHRSE